jgi:polar amino acid transport system permease protein
VDVLIDQYLSWDIVRPYLPDLLRGLWLTLQLTFISLVFSLAGGLLLAVMRQTYAPGGGLLRRALAWVCRAFAVVFIDLWRGLPLLLVILIFYLSFPYLGIPVLEGLSGFQTGILALTIVYSAYMAEILRSGIESVERGQIEAARSLGLSRGQTTRKVVLPQAVRRVLPPLVNEFIILSKDTSLVGVIAVNELVNVARNTQSVTFNSSALTVAAVFYLAFTLPLIRIVDVYIGRDRRRNGGGPVLIP